MPRIVCRYDVCVFNKKSRCTAEEIEYDPDQGCLTAQTREEFAGVVDEEEEWDEDDELKADDEDLSPEGEDELGDELDEEEEDDLFDEDEEEEDEDDAGEDRPTSRRL